MIGHMTQVTAERHSAEQTRQAKFDAERRADQLQARLDIATRALRFYANVENWSQDDWGCDAVIAPPDYGKGGQKARNALKRIETA